MNDQTTHIGVSLKGEYNVTIKRANGTIDETGWFDNIILNQGLDRIMTSVWPSGGANIMTYICVGSGSAPTSANQTYLSGTVVASVAGAFTSAVNSGSPSYVTTTVYTYTFGLGSVVGNISELGVGWGTTSGTLFSRALIVDGGGNPVTITVTNQDQLIIQYRLLSSMTTSDVTGSVVLDGNTYDYTGRALVAHGLHTGGASCWGAAAISQGSSGTTGVLLYGTGSSLGSATSSYPTGTAVDTVPGVVLGAYTNGSFVRDITFTWSPSIGNPSGGVKCIAFGPYKNGGSGYTTPAGNNQLGQYQYEFTPIIPKDNTKSLSLTFRLSISANA